MEKHLRYFSRNKRPHRPANIPSGIVALNKPSGVTSGGCVGRLKYTIRNAYKYPYIRVGHGGTLDPQATGVLALGLEEGCKDLTGFLGGSKKYRGTVELGYETDSLDADGTVLETVDWSHVNPQDIYELLPSLVGTIQQMPPAVSAKTINGRRSYRYVQRGKMDFALANLKPKIVLLKRLEIIRCELPQIEIELDTGSGFYVRSLARDIGRALNTRGTLIQLQRLAHGPLTMEDTLSWEDLDDIKKVEEKLKLSASLFSQQSKEKKRKYLQSDIDSI